MHGLINTAIQSFVCNTYGRERWLRVTRSAGLEYEDFEAMLVYDDADSRAVMSALSDELGRPLSEILEDFGTFLASSPQVGSLRRLMRFGGDSYVEFLHSLDDLPDWARLAVADLELPKLEVQEDLKGQFTLTCHAEIPEFGDVLLGVLRAMADDYGALVLLDRHAGPGDRQVITVTLIETAFAEGKRFELGAHTR